MKTTFDKNVKLIMHHVMYIVLGRLLKLLDHLIVLFTILETKTKIADTFGLWIN